MSCKPSARDQRIVTRARSASQPQDKKRNHQYTTVAAANNQLVPSPRVFSLLKAHPVANPSKLTIRLIEPSEDPTSLGGVSSNPQRRWLQPPALDGRGRSTRPLMPVASQSSCHAPRSMRRHGGERGCCVTLAWFFVCRHLVFILAHI